MASLPRQDTAVTGPPGSFIRVAPWLPSVSPRTARIFFVNGMRWRRGSLLTPAVSSRHTEDQTHRLSVAEEGQRLGLSAPPCPPCSPRLRPHGLLTPFAPAHPLLDHGSLELQICLERSSSGRSHGWFFSPPTAPLQAGLACPACSLACSRRPPPPASWKPCSPTVL